MQKVEGSSPFIRYRYVPNGHAPLLAEGTEYLQFSPAEELARTSEVIVKNFMAAQPA